MKTKERPFGVTSGGEKLAYALGDLGSNFVWTFISSFLTLYYTDSVLMSAGLIGTIMLICRIFDGVSDILMGMLLEKTRTKMARPDRGSAAASFRWSAFSFWYSTCRERCPTVQSSAGSL